MLNHCTGEGTHVHYLKSVSNGVTVGCANQSIIDQTKIDKLPFPNMLEGAQTVDIFYNMPHPLVSCGPLVKNSCYIILDTPVTQVIDKATGDALFTADFESWSAT